MTTENTIKDDYSLLIELKNLFSDEYDIFLEEYLKIVTFLDLETNIDQVRSFILFYIKKKMKDLVSTININRRFSCYLVMSGHYYKFLPLNYKF